MMSKNYFLENNRTTSVMISKYRVNYQELHENTLDFSKIKLFRQTGWHRRNQKKP